MAGGTEALDVNFNPYDHLGILDQQATEKEVVKAFRKKALQWHPDKNAHREDEAKVMFQKISKAFEILSDKAARAAFDRLLKARKAAEERRGALDEKRRKLREQLEARERGVRTQQEEEIFAARLLEQEIGRLRKEGSSLLQRERENIDREIHKDDKKNISEPQATCSVDFTPRLKLKWKSEKMDLNNGGYSEQLLRELFSKYGNITALILNKNKNGSALVEFEDFVSAKSALNFEKGLKDNPLKIGWVQEPPTELLNKQFGGPNLAQSFNPVSAEVSGESKDFESVVLMKMRQAEERKKLIEDMMKEDKQLE